MKYPWHYYTRILLALQLELYQNGRFLRMVYTNKRFFLVENSRQTLVWTMKMRLIALLGIAFLGGIIGAGIFWLGTIGWVIGGTLGIIGMPFLLVLANSLLWPIDRVARAKIIWQAKNKLAQHKSHLKIIGIAGSYGKTSQKEFLAHILKACGIPTLAPSGTLNTPLGISRTITQELTQEHRVFVVEMGEHIPGDVAELTHLVMPDIGIITGITAQHLDRFGSMDAIISTIFELPLAMAKHTECYIDTANAHVQSGYERYKAQYQGVWNLQRSMMADNIRSLDNFGGTAFTYAGTEYTTKLLGAHVVPALVRTIHVAICLGAEPTMLQKAIASLPFVEHRLQPIYNAQNHIMVIDDSFNGNIEGIKATAELFKATKTAGRKIYLTPWLVELGEETQSIHASLGAVLSGVFDRFLLIESPATRALYQWLLENGTKEHQVRFFADAPTAHAKLSEELQSGDTIVFQNDWTDNYA